MTTRTTALTVTSVLSAGLVVMSVLVATSATPAAQKGGGGAKAPSMMNIGSSSSRLDTLEKSFTLTKEQKKAIKTLFDDAHKSAAPIRDALTKAHAALGATVQSGKSQADIDAAAKAYGEQAAAMAGVEMKAMADMMKMLTEQQRANNAAVSSAFYLMRGAFFDNKKWDDTPETRQRY